MAHLENWNAVRELAIRHGVFGLLARNLQWAREQMNWEIPILEELTALRSRQSAVNLRAKIELLRIGQGFTSAGIEFVPIKGVTLAEEILGDISLRSFSDHDILVRDEALPRAIEILEELGYKQQPYRDLAHFRESGLHHTVFLRERSLPVELHWNIFVPRRQPVATDLVWQNCEPVSRTSTLSGLRLSKTLTLVHLASHLIQDDLLHFKTLVDFIQAAGRLEKDIEAADVAWLAEQLGLGPVVEFAALLSRRLVAVKRLVDELSQTASSTRARIASSLLSGERLLYSSYELPTVQTNHLVILLLLTRPRVALNDMFRTLVPSPSELEMTFQQRFTWTLYVVRYLRSVRRLFESSVLTAFHEDKSEVRCDGWRQAT